MRLWHPFIYCTLFLETVYGVQDEKWALEILIVTYGIPNLMFKYCS
jgi:hypothetical protein